MASKPHIVVLEPSPEGHEWQLSKRVFTPDALTDLPNCCYVFLDEVNYPPADGRREKLLAHFNVPEFVANRTCSELNGYFGSKGTYGVEGTTKQVTSFTTWFRCLVKMLKKVDDDHRDDDPEYTTGKKDYEWFEMTFFTRWDSANMSQVLCIDGPPSFPNDLQKALGKSAEPVNFQDPLAMHIPLVDQIIVLADLSVWRIRDPVRRLEKSRKGTGAIFEASHEVSRHAIHAAETLEATIDTVKGIQQRQTTVHQILCSNLGETYTEQARDYVQFQISLLKNLKLRSDSNQERLKNEISLAFNNLARQDNHIMKSISLLGMVFLPPTFISALFSTTFFSFGEGGSWEVSDKLWVYWVTAIPATIISVVLWRIWLARNDTIVQPFKRWLGWVGQPWEDIKLSRQVKKSPRHDSA